MKQYEVTFIIDPVLPSDEINAAAKAYLDLLTNEQCEIVHVDEMGLRQLAYPINKRNSGVYQSIEFKTPSGEVIPMLELSLRRDERIMRFLTVKLDRYGVQYNEDKRNGKIGKKKTKDEEKTKPGQKSYVPQDDLTILEGVDKKTAKLLKTAGVTSYGELAEKSIDDVREILSKGGSTYEGINPESWSQQAALAAEGDWSGLNRLKDNILGNTSSEEE